MIILHCILKQDYEDIRHDAYYGEHHISSDGFLHCSTWNSFYEVAPIFMHDEEERVLLCIDSEQVEAEIKWEDGSQNGVYYPHIYGALNLNSVMEAVPFEHENGKWKGRDCTHILMNTSEVDADWCFSNISKVITPHERVCIVAFSFWDNTTTIEDWNQLYRKPDGMWYDANTDVWKRYGIKEDDVVWVNYFNDSKECARNKILNSSVLFFTGGAPDLMMKRIKEFGLVDIMTNYQGVMIGYSAGAMIQLSDYHITPDEDYETFSYEKGLSLLEGFDIEVHYVGSDIQRKCIENVMGDKHKPIYALYDDGGMIINKREHLLFGHYEIFCE